MGEGGVAIEAHGVMEYVPASEIVAGDVLHINEERYRVSQVTEYEMARFGRVVGTSTGPWPVLHFQLDGYGGIARFSSETVVRAMRVVEHG